MSGLQKTKSITIKGDVYTLDISKFTVNNFISLESEKQRISKSNYYQMATTWFSNTMMAANLVDMIATFRVLLPDLEKSLAESYEKLNLIDVKDVLQVYLKEVSPWYQEWMKEFNAPFEESESDVADEK
jgi:hypothetical protein